MNHHTFKNRIFTTVTLLLALGIGLSSCTQKRPQSFSQGQGLNLDSVEKWAPKFYDLTTGKVIGTTPTTNAQEKVVVSPNLKSMNHYDLVELKIADKSLATLVGSPPFRAKPAQPKGVYQLEIKLTDNYLKIYKVGKPEDLPFDEHFYKEEEFKDGRIAIPLVGYKITGYYRVEAQKNSDDQDSHHLMEVDEDDASKATHVRIDWATREVFEPIKKVDLFPANFFFKIEEIEKDERIERKITPYEWYYSETVTQKSLKDSGTIIGDSGIRDENSKLNPATKVMFLPREGELRVINVARDERLTRDQIQDGADLNAEATMILPIKWRSYRTKDDGTAKSLKGELVEEKKWNERDFFEVDFLNLESAATLNGGRQLGKKAGPTSAEDPSETAKKIVSNIQTGTNRLLDIEIDENYFSFTIMNMVGSNGRKIHYSFLRADNGRLAYTPKRSFKDDRNTFGFFSTTKPFYPNWQYYTQNDFDKRDYMNRINPDQKEIVFHLSTDSPKELYDVTEKSIQAWDRAFQEALKGTGREISIKFSRDPVQLGDIRYNVIHLVDTLQEDGLLGFGPSIADPETGEIIAATTNIYVNSFRSISAQTVRQYIINRLEKRLKFKDEIEAEQKTAPTTVADPISLTGGASAPQSREQAMFERFMNFDASKLESGSKKLADLYKLDAASEKKFREQALGQRCQYAASIASNTSDEEIRRNCPEVEKVIAAHRNDNFLDRLTGSDKWEQVWADVTQEDTKILESCANKITEAKLLSTLIHEVGHNFGLRHNFVGSIDKANFRQVKDRNGKDITPQSSSIMEYTVWEEDRLTEAGKYDIAAIRFGYGDTVDLKDGTALALANDKSIPQNLKAKDKTKDALKPYLFCTDEEAYTGMNALCRPHDAGTTPMEIVDYFISYYQRLQEIRQYRRVRPAQYTLSQAQYAADNLGRIFIPLKEIYDQWRYEFGEYIRKSNRYLSHYVDPKTGEILKDRYYTDLKSMSKDDNYKTVFTTYYPAAVKIYQFFRDVAFGSNQYCIVEEASGKKRAIEFERLRDNISESSRGGVQVRTCAEAATYTASALATILGDSTPKIIDEIGAPVNSYRFDPATTFEENLSQDVIGNGKTRAIAALMLGYRNLNYRNYLNTFMPNMLDEPDHYLEIKDKFISRVADGVTLPETKKFKFDKPEPIFEQETAIFNSMANSIRVGLDVPNATLTGSDYDAGSTKQAILSVYRPQPTENPASFAATLNLNGRVMFASRSQGYELAYGLINSYNKTEHDLDLESIKPGIASALEPTLKKFLPSAAALPTLKTEKLLTLFGFMNGLTSNSGEVLECLYTHAPVLQTLSPIFSKLVQEKRAVLLKFLGADQTPMTADEKAFLDGLAVDYLKTKQQEFKATLEAIPQDFGAKFKKCADDQNATVAHVNKYRKDYTSQKTLILNTLMVFSN